MDSNTLERRQESQQENDCAVLHSGIPEIPATNCCETEEIECDDSDRVTQMYSFNFYNYRNYGSVTISASSIIPSSIGNLTELSVLSLHSSELGGILPNAICELGKLTVLDVHSTRVRDVVPPCIEDSVLLEVYTVYPYLGYRLFANLP